MKKLLFPLFMLAMIVTSCEKDPDMNKLDSDYSVYTDYDNSVHFNEFSTYYLPDSILVPDNSLKANYWKDENAQNIISAVAHEMEQKGYVRTEDKEKANVGIQLSYAQPEQTACHLACLCVRTAIRKLPFQYAIDIKCRQSGICTISLSVKQTIKPENHENENIKTQSSPTYPHRNVTSSLLFHK